MTPKDFMDWAVVALMWAGVVFAWMSIAFLAFNAYKEYQKDWK